MDHVLELGKAAKAASENLRLLESGQKEEILLAIADGLEKEREFILQQNSIDLQNARENGIKESLTDRLALSENRIYKMAEGVRQIVNLVDIIGSSNEVVKRPNGLIIERIRVPLGVVGIIYESRPNVTSDAIALALKTNNAIILRGGKEAINSNKAIVDVIQRCAYDIGLPEGSINLITDTSRESATALMQLRGYVDVLIPRGGAGLIQSVVKNATVPTIETGVGNCHIYVERSADVEMAKQIVINAKTQRPSVCNAAETLLLDRGLGDEKIQDIMQKLSDNEVELHVDESAGKIFGGGILAEEADFAEEYLDMKMAVKIVDTFEDAIAHISKYSSLHSECIVTNDYELSQRFLKTIDAAAVYVNASTRFTDGFEFGMGAEMGISTQKLHVRGPMGLEALTSSKYKIYGNGQIKL